MMGASMLEFATVGVVDDPLAGLAERNMRREPVGRTLAEVAPVTTKPLLCQVAGIPGYVMREQWDYALQAGDIAIFTIDPPGDKEAFRTVLQVAAVVAALYSQNYPLAFKLVVAANVAYNLLVPPTAPSAVAQQAAGNVFSTSLQGNQALLDQPIWKICGRRKVNPPFAAEPYLEYLDAAGGFDGTDLDHQQYYYGLFAVGVGNHVLEAALIGGTPVAHYADVLVAQYLPPGTLPSRALATVTSSTAVNGNLLDSGQYIGGFAACRPGRRCVSIAIDVAAPRGLGKGGAALTVAWRVETRTINDFGVATAGWLLVATGSRTAATNTPQRWTQKIDLPTPARVEVRLVRTDLKDTDSTALHELAWAGLRSYSSEAAPLDASTAHYEVVLRASDQLGQLSQRDIALIVTGMCRTWSPGGGWTSEQATRNPMWWLADLLTSSAWGGAYPDDRVDLQSIYDIAVTADARQDRFDWVFDTASNLWDAAQLIARTCRARVFRRNGVITVARDELATLPVTAFTPRNTMPGSMVTTERLPANEMPDGYVIEYQDNRTWLWTPINCPCPGVGTMLRPIRKRIEGITGATHAQREGLYDAADLLYRTRTTSCKTEMQGVLPAFMSPVRWQPQIVGYGQSGDVAVWTSATLTMTLTEPPDWSAGTLYLTLMRDDGSLTTPVAVTPGAGPTDVVLPVAPDFAPIVNDGTRERPKYLLGPLVGSDELVKVLAIRDGGKGDDGEQLYDLEGVIDDARVHAADAALLPGPGVVQDPIDSGVDAPGGSGAEGGGGSYYLTNLVAHRFDAFSTQGANGPAVLQYKLGTDGRAASFANGPLYISGGLTIYQPNEWMQFGVVEAAVAALYEVRFTKLSTTVSNTFPGTTVITTGDTLATWLPMNAARSVGITVASGAFGPSSGTQLPLIGIDVRVEIRLIGTTTVLSSATIQLRIN